MTIIKYSEIEIDTEKLTEDDMPNEVFREIFTICGVDVAISLLTKMQGNFIQVPARGLIKLEKKIILKEYDGTTASIRRIARNLKTSEFFIREVLSESRINVPCEGQLGLFDNTENEERVSLC